MSLRLTLFTTRPGDGTLPAPIDSEEAAVLDLERLKRMRIHRRPLGQWVVANVGLAIDYRFPRRTRIDVEGVANLPRDRQVFIAMNHTDAYNYWPLQYTMYRRGLPFTATWVKGKYYENEAMGWFMDHTNNIPLPSRGYVITTEFRKGTGDRPDMPTYRALRTLVDTGEVVDPLPDAAARFLNARGGPDAFLEAFDRLFDQMIDEVVRLNREALEVGCNVLVFPQGTRSKRLSKGHTGLAQMSQALGADIVPVGCSGSDHCYPTMRPFSRGGHITYRVGAPLRLDGPALGPHRVTQPFRPLDKRATEPHVAAFEAITDVVMHAIDDLVDPEYRFAPDLSSDGVQGIDRFV